LKQLSEILIGLEISLIKRLEETKNYQEKVSSVMHDLKLFKQKCKVKLVRILCETNLFFGKLNLTVDIIQIVEKYVNGRGIREGGEAVIDVSAEKFWAVENGVRSRKKIYSDNLKEKF